MNRKHLVAAALLVWAASPLSAQSVRAGIDAWQRADYVGAVAIWRPLAEKGDADAEFNLGQAYRLGRGVTTNIAAAKTWFERAANQGHIDAETTLGLLLFQNNDPAEGIKWIRKAAEQGEPRAQLVYGTALVNGDSVAQDPILGYAYVSRSAAQGLAPAKDTLDQLNRMLPEADRKRGNEMALSLGAPATSAPEPVKAIPQPAEVTSAKPQKAVREKPAPEPDMAASTAKPASKAKPAAEAAKSTVKEAATAAPAKAKAAASGNWRIQLGAFSRRSNAEALFKKASAKAALAGREPFYVAAGAVTRLQVGPFESRAAAEAACRATGVPCFAVPAR
jgi:TPR repeat protein